MRSLIYGVSITLSMVALADLPGLTCAVGLPQVPFLSLESMVSADTSTAFPECWSLSALPGSPECALTVGNLLLPFYQIHPWRVGRLPWDLVPPLPLVLAVGTHPQHPPMPAPWHFWGAASFSPSFTWSWFYFHGCPVVTWGDLPPIIARTAAFSPLLGLLTRHFLTDPQIQTLLTWSMPLSSQWEEVNLIQQARCLGTLFAA